MSAKLTIGLNEKGERIRIDDAVYKGASKYYCPICNASLIVKNRVPAELAKREHHFAHEWGSKCTANDETVRHYWAKEIVLEEKSLRLPEGNERITSGLIHLSEAVPEKWIDAYGIRPDVFARTESGKELLIEFYVSHKVTAKKRKIIEENNLNCIEVDLNHVELDKDAIRSFLLEKTDHKEWIGKKNHKEESPRKNDCLNIGNFDLCDYENINGNIQGDGWAADISYNREWDVDESLDLEEETFYPEEIRWDEIPSQDNKVESYHPSKAIQEDVYIAPEQRTCFMCERNLDLACREGDAYAYCGPYISNGLLEQRVNPFRAQSCKQFRYKIKNNNVKV